MRPPTELPLRRALLAQLATVVPGESYVLHTEGHKVLTFHAKHPDVGDLVVYDEGDELTVCIGELTHRHFGNHETDLPEDERAEDAAEQAVQFIQEVLNDEVEFFGNGRAGGSRKRDLKPRGVLSRLIFGRRSYLWSGPIDRASDA